MSSRYPQSSRTDLINDRWSRLAPERQTFLLELEAQTFFVRRLQQLWSELTMNLDRDPLCQQIISRGLAISSRRLAASPVDMFAQVLLRQVWLRTVYERARQARSMRAQASRNTSVEVA